MTTYTADRKGHVTENDSFQDRFLEKCMALQLAGLYLNRL